MIHKIYQKLLSAGSFFIVILFIGTTPAASQFLWKDSTFKISPLRIYAEFDPPQVVSGMIVTLTIRGFLEEGWHIYSLAKQQEDALDPTQVSYQTEEHLPMGALQESTPQIIKDEALGMTLAVHKGEFVFRQQFKISSEALPGEQTFEGTMHYHLCNNKVCTPLKHQSFTAPLSIKPSISNSPPS